MTVKTEEHPAYELMLKESEKHQAPALHKRDLTHHDRKFLEGYDGTFGWVLRSRGTQLQKVIKGPKSEDVYLFGSYPETYDFNRVFGDCIAFYFWDGAKLKECKDEETMKNHMRIAHMRASLGIKR